MLIIDFSFSDSHRTYSGKNDDFPIQIVLIVLEIILVVLNAVPVIYLKCGGQNKAKCQLFLTGKYNDYLDLIIIKGKMPICNRT